MDTNKPQRLTRAHLAAALHANGCGPSNKPIADIAFAMVKAGLDEVMALQLARLAHYAKEGYTWKFEQSENVLCAIHYYLQCKGAEKNPNGKDAEDLAAKREKRPSRWGTPEFHNPARVICADGCINTPSGPALNPEHAAYLDESGF